jgi:acetyl coenzyme A synthetase (ADP forming)-like protein
VRATDRGQLSELFKNLSPRSRAFRFLGGISDEFLLRATEHLADSDGVTSFGLIAIAGPDDHIVGHAMYAKCDGNRAEVAFAIAEVWQGQGLGTLLLGELAQVASSRGIALFQAIVRPENHQMLQVFRDSGFPVRVTSGAGEIRVEFPTELSEAALARFKDREWTAAVSAAHTFFQPASVAVIGASRKHGSIGATVLHNLLSYGFPGPVYPVNPNASMVQGAVAYPSVEDVPGPVDLAVILVRADQVLDVAEACGRKRVHGLVVISAGFAESGETGRMRQEELLGICRSAGMRLMGPNCLGVLNTHPDVRLNATFAPTPPPAGRIGFMSQSGALGLAIMDHAGMLGLGLSTFASVGNRADVSSNDLIRYWEQDPNTGLILLYLESFGNPREFSRIARRVGRVKPIVAVKSGRSPAGVRATGSHTGALIAASDVSVDALFRQAGVIRTDTLEELFNVAALLAGRSAPTGRRVAILSNGGGPAILCADACEAEGLTIPVLPGETQAELRKLLPAESSVANPVDMIASATADQYREAIRIVGRDPTVDALVVIFIPPLVTRPADAARAIADAARRVPEGKPLLTVFMQAHDVPQELRNATPRIPCYAFPEAVAMPLAKVARYGEWLRKPIQPPAHFEDLRRDEAAAIVATALGRGGGWLSPDEVWRLLSCYGLPLLDQRIATSGEAAAEAALQLGEEVALKAIVPGLVHKSEAGAVRLDVNPVEVPQVVREIGARLRWEGKEATGYLVQRMAAPGVEMIVGVVHDQQFGPVVACGAGGVLVELLKDVSVRLAPLSKDEAEEMVHELRTYPLLTGYRNGPVYDVGALVDTILRVGAMVDELPQIVELDLNPVRVHQRGATILDARVRVAPIQPKASTGTTLPGTLPYLEASRATSNPSPPETQATTSLVPGAPSRAVAGK